MRSFNEISLIFIDALIVCIIIFSSIQILKIKPKRVVRNNSEVEEQENYIALFKYLGVLMLISTIIFYFIPLSILDNIRGTLCWLVAFYVCLYFFWIFYGCMRILKFPKEIKAKLKLIKFKNNSFLIKVIGFLTVIIGFACGVYAHINPIVSIFIGMILIAIGHERRNLLPNVDEILEKIFNLKKYNGSKFTKNENKELMDFLYDISKIKMPRGRFLYNISSTMVINSTMTMEYEKKKQLLNAIEDIKEKYYFLNIYVDERKDTIIVNAESVYNYYKGASVRFIISILLSMYQAAEEIAKCIFARND